MDVNNLLKLTSQIDSDLAEIAEYLSNDRSNIPWAMYYVGMVAEKVRQLDGFLKQKQQEDDDE